MRVAVHAHLVAAGLALAAVFGSAPAEAAPPPVASVQTVQYFPGPRPYAYGRPYYRPYPRFYARHYHRRPFFYGPRFHHGYGRHRW